MGKKLKLVVMAVVVLIVVAGSFIGYRHYQEKQYQEKYALIDAIKEAVRNKLLDGISAQFRNVRRPKSDPSIVCGEVNAKNLYGAYTGFTKFYGRGYLDTSPVLESDVYLDSSDKFDHEMYMSMSRGVCETAELSHD